MKAEEEDAIQQRKKSKAPGTDDITVEEIKAVGALGVEVITKLLNEIYYSGFIPDHLLKYIFIAVPKKPGAIDCEDNRTISLMSHVTKISMQIILRRIGSKINPEIGGEQFGFVENKGTNNATYILRTLSEIMIDMNRDINMCPLLTTLRRLIK